MSAETLRAFHGDPAIKKKYVDRMMEHRRLEHLTQGVGYCADGSGVIKGCAVGCTLENYEHGRYPIELGLPEWLARLEDRIFEGLPKGEAEQFAVDFLNVIPVGADVSGVRHQLAILRNQDNLKLLEANKEPYAEQVRAAIRQVLEWLKNPLDEAARSAAESAALAVTDRVSEKSDTARQVSRVLRMVPSQGRRWPPAPAASLNLLYQHPHAYGSAAASMGSTRPRIRSRFVGA